MFTGIITDVGRVSRLRRGHGQDDALELTIATAYDHRSIELGASIACSGVCLTAVAVESGAFTAQASAETLACSTLGGWTEGRPVNLERALKAGDELGGHIVSGHVDGVSRILDRRPEGDSVRFTFQLPEELAPYVASKGSIALDGISLTVNEVGRGSFGVNIIPYTLAHTNLGDASPGQQVNLEIDPLARYVARLLAVRPDFWSES
ncbi:MAG TPA: riboflavin synthase [Stellaceae bacterium]|jgi:riboflavin synthase|nr:riboflavin synthase [Stellaceae bacterium]